MRIIYILPHLEPDVPELETLKRIHRERLMMQYTRSLGYECELYLLTYKKEIWQAPDDPWVSFFPIDNPVSGSKHTYISTALLKEVEAKKPDLVVFKPLGYRINYWLILKCSHMFQYALIIGSGTRDVTASNASYIFAETKGQIRKHFVKQQKEGRTAILPKPVLENDYKSKNIKDFDIINVGRCIPLKNQKKLIPFFSKYRVAIIGDGECYSEIKSYAEEYPENVYMPGNVSREQIPQLLSRSKLMVHPCPIEGLPRVVTEAFACGVPVIGLKNVMEDIFDDGIHGLMVEEEEITDAVKELLNDDDRLSRMGCRALELAKENYSKDAVYTAVDRMYEIVFMNKPSLLTLRKTKINIRFKLLYYDIKRKIIKIKQRLRLYRDKFFKYKKQDAK